MKQRWIISKDARRCGKYHCAGYDKADNKAVVSDEGVITTTCRECGDEVERQARDYKELRACYRCGWQWDVTVHIGHDGREWCKDTCNACELEMSAARHLATYQDFTKRVAKIRRERAVRSKAGRASKEQGEGT